MKTIFGSIVFIGCFAASIFIIIQARHYQVIGQQMPDGKGHLMATSDGYIIGLALLLLSIASLIMVVKSYQRKN